MSNLLVDTHPDVAAQWHPANDVDLATITYGSGRKIRWVCSLGHEWTAKVNTRTSMGSGCPVCRNLLVLEGYNDLQTMLPALAAELDEERTGLRASEIVWKSTKKVWWICPLGHSYDAHVESRRLKGDGCPYCAGRRVLPGFNDLATLEPDLVAEWSPRNEFGPDSVTFRSDRLVWWVCSSGHEWRTKVSARNQKGRNTGCPECWGGMVSQIERSVWSALGDLGVELDLGVLTPMVVGTRRRAPIDAVVRGHKVALEYDGWFWHKGPEKVIRDLRKSNLLMDDGWTVGRIREAPLSGLGIDREGYFELSFNPKNYHEDEAIRRLAEDLQMHITKGI